jgi:Tol biopolymer transport system component
MAAWWLRPAKPPASLPVEIVPLTGISGKQNLPSFSPDGSQITFKLTGDLKKQDGLYTALVGGDKVLRLTDNPADCCPAWSPDGELVAFSRISEQGFDIYTVSPLGGTPRKLYARPPRLNPLLAWSPDGKLLAFSDVEGADQRVITLLSVADHSTRRLTLPPKDFHDSQPSFSPDGKLVAFVRSSGPGAVDDLYLVPVTGGTARRLTFDNRMIYGPPAWTEDGKELVFSSSRAGMQSLWRMPAAGGDPRPVAEASANAYYPAISARSHRLAYKHYVRNNNIWQLTLKDHKHGQGEPSVLVAAQGYSFHPQFSPDGSKIAFESNRSGYQEIWVCNRDGSNPVQVTSMRSLSGTPRWSPDGRYLAFDSRPGDHSEIYTVEVPSGIPRQIATVSGANNVDPSWSRDGRWIYFSSKGEGQLFQVWQVPVTGGPPVQITKNGGFGQLEGRDGFLYYTRGFHVPGVWRISVHGGDEAAVLDTPDAPDWANWAVVNGGMYFVNHRSSPKPALEFLDFATGTRSVVSTLDTTYEGLAVSPDGRSVLYAQSDQDTEQIVVVKNFY